MQWCKRIPDLRAQGIMGPCFVSIGDYKALQLFLETNKDMPRELFLIDDPSMPGYVGMGFKNLFDNNELTLKGAKNLKAPALTFGDWFNWVRTAVTLAPKDQGVLRLGGVFGLYKDAVIYAYEEGVPGDVPDIDEVLLTFEKEKVSRMKVSELKTLLKEKGLPVYGKKNELVDRVFLSTTHPTN